MDEQTRIADLERKLIDSIAANGQLDEDVMAAEAALEVAQRGTELLRWYVESDLVEAGDEFGQWDDDVREFVAALTPSTAPDPREAP